MSVKKVKLGDTEYEVQRFRALKAIMAIAAMTRIARDIPDLMNDAVNSYRSRNSVIITEAMSKLPRWEGFSTEDFDAAEKHGGKREIKVPAVMTPQEQFMYALPLLLERARKEVVRLIALLIIPNKELMEADDNDTVEDSLDKYRKLIEYEADLDQVVDVCFAASDILTEQLGDRGDRLGKMMNQVGSVFLRTMGSNQMPPLPPIPQEQTTEQTSTPQTSPDDAQISSTDSDVPMDGTAEQLSTVSPG